MSDTPDRPREPLDPYAGPEGRRLHWGGIWLGLVIFGAADFGAVAYGVGNEEPLMVIALIVGTAIAAAVSFAAGFRSFALGLLAGYAVMTIVSGGVCTLTFADPLDGGEGALVAVVVYPVFVFVFGIVAAVVHARRKKA